MFWMIQLNWVIWEIICLGFLAQAIVDKIQLLQNKINSAEFIQYAVLTVLNAVSASLIDPSIQFYERYPEESMGRWSGRLLPAC